MIHQIDNIDINKERRQNSLAAAPIYSSQLQPPYIGKAIHIAVECCSILVAASGYEC